MAKMSLEDLKKLRGEKKKEMNQREADKSTSIIIGMGTCGIAAGAKAVFDAFLDELDKSAITNTVVKQTGCMGLCHSEPTVEVQVEGMPQIVYGKVDAKTARRIVQEHLIGKKLVNDHVFDKPSADVIAPSA